MIMLYFCVMNQFLRMIHEAIKHYILEFDYWT